MKYPQLVSTRAVNAISDWLVSRLEQLGVEAPQPYTRLLLSLLQSTIQLNDPIELSNLESFLASRKGGNRRYQNCDTDALKKFNAVQCLKEIVSSEQEIATIENLVDELCEKLKDIEKQTDDSEDEHKLFVATLNLAQQTQHHNSHINSHHHSHKSHHHHNHQTKEIPAHSKNCNLSKGGGGGGGEGAKQPPPHTAAGANKSITEEREDDSELDPLDLYRRAFPALSKEMENSFVTYRRNVKWLTWPVQQHNHRDHTISISSSSSTISSNSAAEGDGSTKDVVVATTSSLKQSHAKGKKMINTSSENASKMPRQEFEFENVAIDVNDNEADISVNASAFASANSAVGGIKRKTKRRRSQGLSKGKIIQLNARKNLTSGIASSSASTSMQNNGGNTASSGKSKRNASPTYWDTDFEGCWEMGRDLIKEFITRQNRNCRNRSTSESAVAYKKKNTNAMSTINKNIDADEEITLSIDKQQQDQAKGEVEDEKIKSLKDTTGTPTMPVVVDFSFCDYDEYDDTLASVSELTNDGPFLKICAENDASAGATATHPKRLYERELLPQNSEMKSDEQSDFAQFEAKFNSSVEALWKDAGSDEEKAAGFKSIGHDNKMHVFGFGSGSNMHFSGPTSLPYDMPFRQNLKNFWTNYYNHHFDLSKMLPASLNVVGNRQEINEIMQQSKTNVNSRGGAAYNKSNVGMLSDSSEKIVNFPITQINSSTIAPTSDYYSMPSTLDNMNKAKLLRSSLRHNSGCSESGGNGAIGEERKTPVALFLQNSIWSENANMDGGDTDESFFYKVHNSGRRLNASNNNNCEQNLQSDAINSSSRGSGFVFNAPYTGSKWSEGINAGPPTNNMIMLAKQQSGSQKNNNNFKMSLNSLSGTDCTDSSTSSLAAAAALSTSSTSASTTTNWQLVKGGNTQQPDGLQNTWFATNQKPNTAEQMRDSKATHQQQPSAARYIEHESNSSILTPKITLVNHSPTTSGFIAYSRIKSLLQLPMPNEENASNAKQQLQRNYPPRANIKEQQQRYALDMLEDGENLLTSERTHFHPIKSYADGHTFDICSELDVIEYQRSASGYLYFEQEKYLEYTRNDNFMVEDDGGGAVGASANPLYANSNCVAATANYNNQHNKNMRNAKLKRFERDFVIKFRVQRTEIACQTDVVPPTNARSLIGSNHKRVFGLNVTATSQPHPLSLIFSNAAKNLKATAANQFVYSDTVEAFTRAMAHFPPPEASNSIWLPLGADVGVEEQQSASTVSHIWNIYQQHSKGHNKNAKKYSKSNKEEYNNAKANDPGYDEIDFYGSCADTICHRGTMTSMDTDVDMISLEQEWSMNEIRRKCKEAGHMTSYANVNNTINNQNNNNDGSGNVDAGDDGAAAADGGGGAIESVWGMCAACNSELKSIPANRLLRDELQVEADEIMSDLKYMQDLYIGRADDCDGDGDGDRDGDDADDEDDGCADDEDESGAETVTSDSDWCAEDVTAEVQEDIKNIKESVSPPESQQAATSSINAVTHTDTDADAATVTQKESDTLTVIQKVNRLIAELLRPENNTDGDFNMEKFSDNITRSASEESRAARAETEIAATATAAASSQFSGNLWHTNTNERNIWQINAADSDSGIKFGTDMCIGKITGSVSGISDISSIHPIQLLRQFNVKPVEAMASNVGNIWPLPASVNSDSYHTQMSWEHENLARIWQTSPKVQSQQPQPEQQQQQQPPLQEENMGIIDFYDLPTTVVSNLTETQEDTDIAEKNMRNLRANADASVEAAASNLQKAQEFLARHNHSKEENDFTGAQLQDSALKLKAVTRKRRHSASQNYFHTQLSGGGTTVETTAAAFKNIIGGTSTALLHNNNSNKIADLNSYALESNATTNNNELNFQNLLNASLHFGAAAAAAVAASNAKNCSDYATNQLCGTNIAYGCDTTAAAAKNHTIITCKYHLTTIEPRAMHNNNDGIDDVGLFDGITTTAPPPLSCLIDKNSSILNHVTMMSRPLTR